MAEISRRQWLRTPLLAFPFISACNRDRRKLIGVIPKGRSHVFWQSVHAGAAKAAGENGVDIEWNGPAMETDTATQVGIVETMINKRVDAIVLAPIDRNALVSPVDRAVRQEIPVVIFDSPVDTDKFTAQIATDNYKGGELGAQRIGAILSGKGKIAMAATQAGSASTMAREQGFEDYLAKHFPDIRIVDKRYGDSDYAKSLRVAENMLTAHPDIDAFFASNESSTAGTAQCLKARNSKVKLVGFDSGPNLVADLRAGVIDSLVVQHPFRMGYDSVNAVMKHFRSEKQERIQDIEPRLVTRDNVDQKDIQEQINPDLKKYLG